MTEWTSTSGELSEPELKKVGGKESFFVLLTFELLSLLEHREVLRHIYSERASPR